MGANSCKEEPMQHPRMRKYEFGIVYLFTVPITAWSPCISSYALKLETWLRAKSIQYVAIRSLYYQSAKGQIPFVELDGDEINESTLVIQELKRRFEIDEEKSMTEEQKGSMRAVEMMLANNTEWSIDYRRMTKHCHEFVDSLTFLGGINKALIVHFAARRAVRRAESHGIGRNLPSEILKIGNDDIKAISQILGNKRYLTGDVIVAADCAVFGHLAQVYYAPYTTGHKEFMLAETPNLTKYLDRIREEYWPDWERLCQQ